MDEAARWRACPAARLDRRRRRGRTTDNGKAIMTAGALVLFSGGQDSTTCLAWALERFGAVETVGFAYGQRHHVEMSCRETVLASMRRDFPHWRDGIGEDHVVALDALGALSRTSLTQDMAFAMEKDGLPN